MQPSDFVDGDYADDDFVLRQAADGTCKRVPVDSITPNDDGTVNAVINGEECILSTERVDISCADGAVRVDITDLKTNEVESLCFNPTLERSPLGNTPAIRVRGSDGWEPGDVVTRAAFTVSPPKCGGNLSIRGAGGLSHRVNTNTPCSFTFGYFLIDETGVASRLFYGGATGSDDTANVPLFQEQNVSMWGSNPWSRLAKADNIPRTVTLEIRMGANGMKPEHVVDLNRTDIDALIAKMCCCVPEGE